MKQNRIDIMLVTVEVLTIVLIATATALALAHALEWPGKLRLQKDQYLAVQAIYYPGFTIGGAAEPAALLLTAILLLLTPAGTPGSWLIAAALVGMLAMHATYWILTHPVNNFWLKDTRLEGVGARFFAVGASRGSDEKRGEDWTALRDRWEWSHVVRAALGLISLILIATAIAL
ncbi:anthrone oxygenase family protein [Ensifer aridi]|uniref:anthrone oxygenase family protein n=2 Tax=Ensifer aridi TaxID=1708715 RepID=UPI0003FA691F